MSKATRKKNKARREKRDAEQGPARFVSARKWLSGHAALQRLFFRRKLIIAAGIVLSLVAAAGVGAQWSGLFSSTRVSGTRVNNAPQSATTSALDAASPSKEMIYEGGRLLATEEPAGTPGCSFTLSATSQSFAASGGAGSVAVTTTTGCGWTATSNASWVTITSGASGSGSGAVGYSVTVNTGPARQGTMTIAGLDFTVNQDSGCVLTINPASASYTTGGGAGSVAITANNQTCPWTAVSNNSWITITSGSGGVGSGTTGYSVASNTGAPRTGTMTIAGQSFTVSQQGAGCSYSITPTTQQFVAAGGTGSVTVTTQTGCAWTATSNAAWITITSGASSTGSATVGYSVTVNTGPARQGTVTIAGLTLTVNQDSGCLLTINPTSASYTTSGGAGSITITANNQACPWTAVSNNSWITITSGASGTGNGTTGYSVASNTGAPRSGSITVAGQTFSVSQDGVASACQVSTFAGNGTAGYAEGTTSQWNAPVGAVFGKSPASGNPDALFVADTNNNRIRMVLLSSGSPALIAGDGVAGYSEGAGNPLAARYNHPKGITAIKDANGVVTTLLVADTDNHVIRKLAWNGSAWVPSIFSGSGGKGPGYVDGTASSSRYNQPQAISAASSSVIFVADTANGKIRKLDQAGASSTQAATGVNTPVGVAAATTKLVYVSDQARHTIWQVSTSSTTATRMAGNDVAGFADGTGTGALFNTPRQLVWTAGDVLYIADSNNFRVRKLVIATQAVTTLAGSGGQGSADGACGAATFRGPQGVAYGPLGEVYVVDTADNKIRKVTP